MATKERRSFDAMEALRAVREFAQETWRRMVKGGDEPSARNRPDLRPVGEGETFAAGAAAPRPTEATAKAAAERRTRRQTPSPKRGAVKPAEPTRPRRAPAVEKPTEAMAKAAADKARRRRGEEKTTRGVEKAAKPRPTTAATTDRAPNRRARAGAAPAVKPVSLAKPTRARKGPASSETTTPAAGLDDAERWNRYVKALPDRSRRFLELLEQRKTLSTDEMIDALGLEGPRTVGGVIGGIRRWAPLYGVTPPFDAREDDLGNRVFRWTGR